MKKISILCLTLLSFLFSESQVRYLKGTLQSSQETPAVTAPGSGVVIVKYDVGAKTLELFGNYAGLTAVISGSHIHLGQPGVPGEIVTELVNTGDTTGTLTGRATYTQEQQDALLAGNMYANVHTSTNPGGELRAQLTLTSEQSTFLSANLQGAQEIPVTPSTATGAAYALLDMADRSVSVTGRFTGLTAAANNAHVHLALPGAAGPPLFTISFSARNAGTVHAMATVDAAQAASIAAGGSYVNIHTSTYPDGEIRGQLINTTGVRYLTADLKGSNERPAPVESAARGVVIATYNTQTRFLQLAGDFQRLSDTVTGAHIHLGGPEVAGDVIIPLAVEPDNDSTGTISLAGATITEQQGTELLAGNMYVNVHSKTYPGGEIRAQLMPTTAGETHVFAVNLNEQQVRPTSTGTAAGQALVIVDKTTGYTYVTGTFGGINSNVIAAHLHSGAAGATGSIISNLFVAQRAPVPHSGTFSGIDTLSPSEADAMINGTTYVDVHSQFYTNQAAIRAQLGDLLLPVKLTNFNAYKQKNEIEVVWETTEEVNISRYEVEQLNTVTNQWATKGTVYANGGSSLAKYSFKDIPNTYGSKYMIYRLKMIDKDGEFSYSYIVKVNFDKLKPELFIQTNPVTNGELRYTITGLLAGKKAEVSIIDFNGRLILRNTVSSFINNTLKIPHLSAGMYKLVVRVDKDVMQQNFIK